MNRECDNCGKYLVPVNEVGWMCYSCPHDAEWNEPRVYGFCGEHPGNSHTEDNRVMCDWCMLRKMLGEEKWQEIMAVEAERVQESGRQTAM
ncbi:MAG TPA: hypothetical protein VKK79_12010 [Candidatus Lokiarchaeia archaeon]|nr:hypothetical protein [Candidatus Lokiarchaeia archaeon]